MFIISVACSYVPERVTSLSLPKSVTELDTSCERGICVTNDLAHTFSPWLNANILSGWLLTLQTEMFLSNNCWMELWKQHNSYGFYLNISRHHLLLTYPIAKYFQFSRRSLSSWRTRRNKKWVIGSRMFECQTDGDRPVRYNMTWISIKSYLCMNILVDKCIALYKWIPLLHPGTTDFHTPPISSLKIPCPSPS